MDILYFATFFVALISSFLSGISGGGGGFVMSPYWLILGMSPAQSTAASAFMSTGMSISSMAAFRKTEHFPSSKKLSAILLFITFVGSILGVIFIPKIDTQAFKHILAIITIASLPLIFIKPKIKQKLYRYRKLGLALAALLLIIGSIVVSSAFSILFALTLMTFFNMSVFQMTALRRTIGIVQSVILLSAFALQGLLIWQHAAAGFIGGSLGSYIGTKYAIKKGEVFAKYALAIMSFIGAALLFATA